MKLQVSRVCRQLDFHDPIVYTFVPWSADFIGHLGEKMVIYHITDEFTEFTGTDKSAILDMEIPSRTQPPEALQEMAAYERISSDAILSPSSPKMN